MGPFSKGLETYELELSRSDMQRNLSPDLIHIQPPGDIS
jgi:hypothetical protein